MKKILRSSLILVAILLLSGCSGGGAKKGTKIPDAVFGELHESYLSDVTLNGDFTLTYTCTVERESGTLEDSELDFSLL